MKSLFLEEKYYSRLFLAGIVNGIGDRFSQVALLVLLIQITGSGLAVGITLAIRVIPFLLFGAIGGFLADRFCKRNILIFTDLFRIGFAISFVFVDDESMVWVAYVSTLMLATGEAIYAPARKSLIPSLVRRENIIKINSLEQVMLGVVLVVGAFAGGVVTYFLGPNMTFWLNGFSFLFAALIIWTLPKMNRHRKEKNEVVEAKPSIYHSLRTLKHLIALSSPLLIAILFEMLVPLFNGIDNVLISLYAVQEFKLDEIGVGLFYGALGIGLMLSFFVSRHLQKHLVTIGLLMLIVEGILHIVLSQVPFAWTAFVVYVLASFVSGICNTCIDSIIMNETPKENQGMMFGFLTTLTNSLFGLSMFTAGMTLETFHNRTLGFIGGCGFVLIGIILMMIFTVKEKQRFSVRG